MKPKTGAPWKGCEESSHPVGAPLGCGRRWFQRTGGCARFRSLNPRLIYLHASGVRRGSFCFPRLVRNCQRQRQSGCLNLSSRGGGGRIDARLVPVLLDQIVLNSDGIEVVPLVFEVWIVRIFGGAL